MGKKSKNPKKNKKANTKASAAEGATEKSSTSNGMNSDSTNVNTTGDAEVHVDVDCDVDVPVTNDADDQVDQTKGGDNGDDVEGIKADVSDAITNEDNEIVEEDAQQAPETDPEPEAVEPQPEPLAAEIEEPEEETPAVLEDSDPATGFISEIETDAEDETAEDDNSLTAPAPEPEEHEPAPVEQDADDVDAEPKAPTEDSPPVPAEIEPIAADEKGEPEEQIDGPRPIVIAGPSGAGKGTLISILMERYPDKQFGFSVSHTTRQPRSGEINTVHYNFTTVDSMKSEIDDGKFIEYAEVHGNYYGTSIEAVQSVTQKGQVCILDIDIQGVQLVKESKLNPYYIFIAPPSMEHLEKRLRGRGTEKEEDIQKRLANAKGEMDYGQVEGNFDMYLVNNDLNVASDELCGTVASWFPHLKRAEVETETEVDEVVTGAGQGVVPEDEADPKDSETNTEVMDNVSPDPVNVEESLEFPEDEVDDSVLESEKVTVVAELETQPSPEPEPEPEPEPVAVTEEVQDKGALDIEVSTEEIATTPEPKNPEPAVEVSTEPPAVEEIEKTSDENVEIKSDPQDKPEKQEVTNATNSEPVTATKEVVNPNAKGIHYSLEELMFPIEGVDWAQRQAYLSDDDFQQHFGMTQSEFNALPKWKKQAAKKKVGIF